METMYFVLGMLSIIAAAFMAVVVWGLLKIRQQQQSLNYIQRMIDDAPRELNERFNVVYRDLDDRTTYIHRRIDETTSYVDSRIDKALGITGAKQVIKG
jgi:hypothetical protein